jgi:hypothetical protein
VAGETPDPPQTQGGRPDSASAQRATALNAALTRAGINAPARSPQKSRIRTELRSDLAAIKAMPDKDLALELMAVETNIDIIRSDLTAEHQHETNRGSQWMRSAERVLSHAKARRALCSNEITRRRQEEQQMAAERHAATVREAAAAKLRIAQENNARDKNARFVHKAKKMLPPEAVHAIWQAVLADDPDAPRRQTPPDETPGTRRRCRALSEAIRRELARRTPADAKSHPKDHPTSYCNPWKTSQTAHTIGPPGNACAAVVNAWRVLRPLT